MNKILSVLIIAAVAAIAAPAVAQVDQTTLTAICLTGSANTASAVVKGEVEAIKCVIPANSTATVSIATSQGQTLFSRSCTGSVFYRVRGTVTDVDGTLIASTFGPGVVAQAKTNTVTQYDRFYVADTITATFTPHADMGGVTKTNAAIIIWKRN